MPDRKVVKKFFEYKLDNKKVEKGPFNPTLMIILALIGAVAGSMLQKEPGMVGLPIIGLAIIGLVVGYVISRHNLNAEYNRRLKEKEKNNQEFEALAREVRAINGEDLVKAFLRVFERTQIERQKLRILEMKFISTKESDLLSEETRHQKFGDLVNKSIRLISKGDFSNTYSRLVQLPGEYQEEFFNPIRLAAIFLAPSQLVICDVQIDCIDGNLREEIHRIPYPKIVNVNFTAERKRLNLNVDVDLVVQTAQDLGYDEESVKQIRKSFEKEDGKETEPEWVWEEMTSQLFITRTDSGALSFPIRSRNYFGKRVSALDQAEVLTKDEISVDRMVNELNRLIEKFNLAPSATANEDNESVQPKSNF